MRSGFSSARRLNVSSAFSAVLTEKPFFWSRSVMNISSVFESSTTRIFCIVIFTPSLSPNLASLRRLRRAELLHRLQQQIHGKRQGEVVLRAEHEAAGHV